MKNKTSVGGLCTKQRKPQYRKYHFYGGQCPVDSDDGGDCCSCPVYQFCSVREVSEIIFA